GPVGLAAALLVADRGYDVALVGPLAPAEERTSALLAGSIALIDRIGVWRTVAPAAAPLKHLRIVDATSRLIRAPEVTFHAHEIDLDAFGHNVPNSALVAALEAAVAERPIARINDLVRAVACHPDALTLELAGGGTIAAKLVVAADGRRSAVRDGLGIPVSEWRYDQSALVCNLGHALAHDDTSTEFHTETGPFTLVPLPGRRSSLVWVDAPHQTERRLGLGDGELAAEIERQSASILGEISIEGRRQAFPLSGMTARRLTGPRAMLVGEAAHAFPPIGAQGLNLGYRDVAALDAILCDPRTDPGADDGLAAYQRLRRADVAVRAAAVDALNRTLLSDFLPVQGLRGFGLFLLDRVPALRRLAMRQGVG
ncbi:MAG: UbiH/UbiF family hydroxylase, partial [Bauldia sp.]